MHSEKESVSSYKYECNEFVCCYKQLLLPLHGIGICEWNVSSVGKSIVASYSFWKRFTLKDNIQSTFCRVSSNVAPLLIISVLCRKIGFVENWSIVIVSNLCHTQPQITSINPLRENVTRRISHSRNSCKIYARTEHEISSDGWTAGTQIAQHFFFSSARYPH